MNFKNTTITFVAAFLALMLGSLFFYFPGWIYVALILSYVLIIAIASFNMGLQFFQPAFVGLNKHTKNQVAITFDDGPHPEYTKKVLDLLQRFNAKATFFCIGKNIEKFPKTADHIVKAGHELGNHSYSHKNRISFNGTKCWLAELEKTDALLHDATGKKTNLFRPPFGVTTPHLAKAIGLSNHKTIGWNIRPFDTSIKHKDAVVKHIVKRIKPGSVILLHDTHDRIPYILERLLLFLQESGYESVSISELLRHDT